MAHVENIPEVRKNIRSALARKLKAFTSGLKKAGLLILRESQKIVPVDYGDLRASGFVRAENAGTAYVVVLIGYTVFYAIYVHEDLDKAHGAAFNAKYAAELARAAKLRRRRLGGTTGPFRHSRKPEEQAKFLEQPFRQLQKVVLIIIRTEVAAA